MRKDKAESVDVSGWAASLQGPIGPASVVGREDLSFPIPIQPYGTNLTQSLNVEIPPCAHD